MTSPMNNGGGGSGRRSNNGGSGRGLVIGIIIGIIGTLVITNMINTNVIFKELTDYTYQYVSSTTTSSSTEQENNNGLSSSSTPSSSSTSRSDWPGVAVEELGHPLVKKGTNFVSKSRELLIFSRICSS